MRVERRQNRKNRIKKYLRRFIILLFLLLAIYVGYGMYKESIIRLEDEDVQYSKIISKVNTIEDEAKKEVKIPTTYKGYEVSSKVEIPTIHFEALILKEYTTKTMKVSPCLYWGPEPNTIGNYCIAGHNYEQDNMFNHLIDLKVGDKIYLSDNENGQYTYYIYDIYKVKPENTKPLSQDTDGKKEITLITCVNYSQNRLIIKASER